MVFPASDIVRLQKSVDELIQSGGGYWEGLAAIARLLEELGELHAELRQGSALRANEAADVLAVCLSLCIQYKIGARHEVDEAPVAMSEVDLFGELVTCCGVLGRVVNCVEGHKPLKAGERLARVHESMSRIPGLLVRLAETSQAKFIETTLAEISRKTGRDRRRFATRIDPCCAPVLSKMGTPVDQPWLSTALGATHSLNSKNDIDEIVDQAVRYSRIADYAPETDFYVEIASDQAASKLLEARLFERLARFEAEMVKTPGGEFVLKLSCTEAALT